MTGTLSDDIGRFIQDISCRREAIKEDFCKAYLAAKMPPGEGVDWIMSNVQLVERWSEDRLTVTWYFEVKK